MIKNVNISVLIPNYNNALYLEESINSVLRQSYQPIEVIIIDDCSTDYSRKIIDRYHNEYPDLIKVFYNEENLGLVGCLNKYIPYTVGDFICKVDADDILELNYLEAISSAMLLSDENVVVFYTDMRLFGPHATEIYEAVKASQLDPLKKEQLITNFPEFNEKSSQILQDGNFINSSSIYLKDIFYKLGGFKYDPLIPEDHDFFRRAVNMGFNAHKVNNTYLHYRQHSYAQLTRKIYVKNLESELYNKKELLGVKDEKIKDLNQQITDLSFSLQLLKNDLNNIKLELKEKNLLITEQDESIKWHDEFIRAIHNSLSWKITSPLRFIGNFLRRIF